MSDQSLKDLLLLTMTPGLGPVLTRRCLQRFGSATAVVNASAQELAMVEGIGLVGAGTIRKAMDELSSGDHLDREREAMDQLGVHLLVRGQSGYPSLLEHIPDPPIVLYIRGQWRDSDALALAIVGSRRCTLYGREQADRIASQCAQAGLTIVSGGAYGIDASAHRAALRVGGRTLAILGSGLAQPYPVDHADLFDQIADSGAVISELPMHSPPLAENFPRRNRIISGLSLGVLVVEAALRSGALITARLANEEHHREVMALPGRVDSRASEGCHKMIREAWATLVTSPADVLDALGETGSLLKASLPKTSAPQTTDSAPSLFTQNLTDSQNKIVQILADGQSLPLDHLAACTGLPIATIQADLTLLQIRSLIQRRDGLYMRARP